MKERFGVGWLLAVSLGASAGMHLVGFGAFQSHDEVLTAGSAPAEFARLGNSFADMSAGRLSPETPETIEGVTPTETLEPIASALTPETVQTQNGVQPPMEQAEISPAVGNTSAIPELTESTTVVIQSNTPVSLSVQTTTSQTQEAVSAQRTLDVVTGHAPVDVRTPEPTTARPQARPDRRPPATQQRSQPAQTTPSQGSTGGEANTRRGQDDGREDATASTAAPRSNGISEQAGHAAAANYGGLIWRQLRRTRRVRAGGRGVATVGFRLTTGGDVASTYVISSSGNGDVDQAAEQHIYRSAPFPPPPQGAQTEFAYEYEGRR